MSGMLLSYLQPARKEISFEHSRKKHVESNPKTTKCVSGERELSSNYKLQKHHGKNHGLKAKKSSHYVADLNEILEKEKHSDQLRREELNGRFRDGK